MNAYRFMKKSPLRFGDVLPFLLAILFAAGIYWVYNTLSFANKETVKHEAVVEQIKVMGKLQVVQLQIRDVVEYKVERNLFLPDSKVLMIVAGEIGACIDLQKIEEKDVQRTDEKTIITLPNPEVCYVKVSHERSKVYDKKSYIFLDDDAALLDQAYKEAEKFLNRKDVQEPAISQAFKVAPTILSPVFEQIAGQPVEIRFRKSPFVN